MESAYLEAKVLKDLNHPNIGNNYEVFLEKIF
jgi:hypothetical protein